ncbi:MAG: serine/threonine protein kinase [Planctomycetes bacterium]|nr:serine/threonine protein kinase [Planctomycetota bacterium]
MTWGGRSFERSLSSTGRFIQRQFWLWPLLAVLVLASIGFWVRRAIEQTMRDSLRSQLTTLLATETAMLKKWFEVQRKLAETMANDPEVRRAVYPLLGITDEADADQSAVLEAARKELDKSLAPELATAGLNGYFVADRQMQIVASSYPMLVGQQGIQPYESFLERVLNGASVVSVPFPSAVMMKDDSGELRTGVPTMYACAPIRDTNFRVVGALALQLRPEREFTEILQLGRIGESGETYAFNREGVMVSNSRFDEDLILLGILPDQPHVRSILNVMIRDPGGDMTAGYRPTRRRSEMSLTRMAASGVTGESGVDVDGYRDYRGVMVVGAWTWLPELDLGVATELDVAEAFRPLTILRRVFLALYVLLVASAISLLVFGLIVARLRRKAAKAAIEAQRLGQYTLEQKIGEGAMGVVYRARHALLRRPTAIKMLDVDKMNDTAIARFEREVQITCQLNHPSTVVIYDYGRTPEGVFYYAMEYLDGIDLQRLVDGYGPQPAGRVIHILRQVCGSLFEAHAQGLVHRDIKPANVMLNRRGGEPDVVKVLDFGLVKDVAAEHPSSGDGGLAGTPLYMSPEAIQSPMAVDARSDIYSVGAVGYFLLTGRPVFDVHDFSELARKHVQEMPEPPSKRVGKRFSEPLEYAILACLEKSPAKRPQTARDLANLLKKCPEASAWSLEDADAWWSRHERGESPSHDSASEASSVGPTPDAYSRTILSDGDQ